MSGRASGQGDAYTRVRDANTSTHTVPLQQHQRNTTSVSTAGVRTVGVRVQVEQCRKGVGIWPTLKTGTFT
jgi:hypothetical protein